MTEMTKELFNLIIDDIKDMIKTIEKKHGVVLGKYSSLWDSTGLTVKLNIHIDDGLDPLVSSARADFQKYSLYLILNGKFLSIGDKLLLPSGQHIKIEGMDGRKKIVFSKDGKPGKYFVLNVSDLEKLKAA